MLNSFKANTFGAKTFIPIFGIRVVVAAVTIAFMRFTKTMRTMVFRSR